jgi:glycerol-3-phosphate O-acyltransferase
LNAENLNNKLPLAYVEPDIYNWGLYKLSLNKQEFLGEVIQNVYSKLKAELKDSKSIYEEIAHTLYQERIRISSSRWKSDPKDDKDFWNHIKGSLISIKKNKNWQEEEKQALDAIFKKILYRYAYEIVGNFNPTVFNTVQKFLPGIFSFFLNSQSGYRFKIPFCKKLPFYEKFQIQGDFEHIRSLAKIGNIIIVPTHSSNVDSPIIGWALNAIGLEAVTYGAGVNLFGTQPLSYLMGNLGAYKIDRRKKNKIYLELLKTYSKIAIQRNTPSLFYPGGTRSRSGMLETKLKLGLLSTAVEAQQYNYKNQGKKIFVIPAVLNYHFNIEASSLINQYLKEIGKEKYVADNFEYSSTYKMIRLAKQLFASNPELIVTFGAPMDVIGHPVNQKGESLGQQGQIFDIKGYFEIENKIVDDEQRNFEYTKVLGDKIVSSYYKNNTLLSSNVVAFTLFEMIQQKHPNLSLYELFLLPIEDRMIEKSKFYEKLNSLREGIRESVNKGKVKATHRILNEDIVTIVNHAIENINIFSSKKIIFIDSDQNLNSEDLKCLFFYHNRLKGYQFEKYLSAH